MLPLAQIVLQAPQLFGSDSVSTHTPPQETRPFRQVQAPITHEVPPVHAVPHPPQLLLSLWAFTQELPQGLRPTGQITPHTPAVQSCPLGQTLPQAPQLLPSVVVLVQALPVQVGVAPAHAMQAAPPLPHAPLAVPGWHAPPTQQPPLHALCCISLQLVSQVWLTVLQALPRGQSDGSMQPQAPATQA